MHKLLAFDTSTEALSIAVRHGDQLLEHSGMGGAQSSTTLIPADPATAGRRRLALRELDAIAFGRGPGSFTGLRTACSVAQGLGFGAGVRLLPIDTLHAVAEEARHRFGARAWSWCSMRAWTRSTRPATTSSVESLPARPSCWRPKGVAGAGRMGAGRQCLPRLWRPPARRAARHEVLPTAAAMLRLAPALIAAGRTVAPADAWPLYVRDKVAQTTEERARRVKARGHAYQTDERSPQPPREARLEPITLERLPASARSSRRPTPIPGRPPISSIRWMPATTASAWWAPLPTAAPPRRRVAPVPSGAAQRFAGRRDLIGYFVAMKGVDEVHLLNITVAPAFQRQGWAPLMLEALAGWSRGQDAQWLWLEVRASNLRALAIYERNGFRRVGMRKGYYPAQDNAREDAVVMSLRLNESGSAWGGLK